MNTVSFADSIDDGMGAAREHYGLSQIQRYVRVAKFLTDTEVARAAVDYYKQPH